MCVCVYERERERESKEPLLSAGFDDDFVDDDWMHGCTKAIPRMNINIRLFVKY